MHTGDELPTIDHRESIAEAIMQMTRSRLGMCAVLDDDRSLAGIVTDGDLRRHVDKLGDIRNTPVEAIMTASPRTIRAHELAAAAVELMQHHRIQGVLVTDEEGTLVGALNFQDLLQAGVV
jgi:arabinose-5-phosphate isomerase